MKFSQLQNTKINESLHYDIQSIINDIKSHMSIIVNQPDRKNLYMYAFHTARDALDLCIDLIEEKGLYAELEKTQKIYV